MNLVIIVLLVLLLLGAIGSAPAWPYSQNWGPLPMGGLGTLLLILLILWLFGVFR